MSINLDWINEKRAEINLDWINEKRAEYGLPPIVDVGVIPLDTATAKAYAEKLKNLGQAIPPVKVRENFRLIEIEDE